MIASSESVFRLVEPLDTQQENALILAVGDVNEGAARFLSHSRASAELIHEAIELTGETGDASLVIANFYETGTVRRVDLPLFGRLITELDPPTEDVSRKLLHLADERPNEAEAYEELYDDLADAELEVNWRNNVHLTNNQGLAAIIVGNELQPSVYDEMPDDIFGKDAPETKIARQLGLDATSFENELVWRDGEPVLLSPREHLALGRLAADGSFEHVVTVLEKRHPARLG